jgi:plastocyanin
LRRDRRRHIFLRVMVLWIAAAALAHGTDLKGRVSVAAPDGALRTDRDTIVVLWLTPISGSPRPAVASQSTPSRLRLVQKKKRFDPHVMVVEVGSVVDFPNGDPFFHNVFSLFDGKRFDLGLYEAGSTRSVRFDRPGICYIFCNIHPEMSAVVLVLDTPYFAISSPAGDFAIPQVPPGRYQLNVWEERCLPKTLSELSRQVTIGEDSTILGTIHLQESREMITVHSNKYGKSYDPQVFSNPMYVQP